ncbi:hypothetical protein AJ80_00492 [Polytolypa hystricis UAMH7299]|uniref:Mediator of RNA polymerase II transcription subunit 7 n=1 Tax=Polytolypa hystricis (strain UAMH7299) TaxID=1447883 RepID=A0A2B7Z262_POLH7|nr:hypothetical protein AJ80_00492 [Polytolypa hystricis UAMH7299]
MAETSQQRAVTAAFPPPPPFWRHFTSQNLEKLEELKKQAGNKDGGHKDWTPEALRALEAPPELRFLVPPDHPSEGSYSLFGESQAVSINLPSLEEQGIEQLYPSPPHGAESSQSLPSNHRYYLLKISKSLLLNFLEFVGILSICPEQFEPKLESIRNLFINAHHLLNLYRPHQARESLILMMEKQLEQTREEIKEMESVKEKVEKFLFQLETDGKEQAELAQPSRDIPVDTDAGAKEQALEEARSMWQLIDEISEG